AAGCRNTKRCPTSTRMRTRLRSSTSSSKTKAGSATTTWPSRRNRASSSRPPDARDAQMLAPGALIELWERGATRGALERGLLLLGAAAPEIAADALADVDLCTRDARVFALRTALFGARFAGVADCPNCAVRLEFDVELRPALPAPHTGGALRLP